MTRSHRSHGAGGVRGWHRVGAGLLVVPAVIQLSGCGFRGLNSFTLPGTKGGGPGSFTVQAQEIGRASCRERVYLCV